MYRCIRKQLNDLVLDQRHLQVPHQILNWSRQHPVIGHTVLEASNPLPRFGFLQCEAISFGASVLLPLDWPIWNSLPLLARSLVRLGFVEIHHQFINISFGDFSKNGFNISIRLTSDFISQNGSSVINFTNIFNWCLGLYSPPDLGVPI